MDYTPADVQDHPDGVSSSISAMPWEIALELAKHMDPKRRSAWRLANKAACQAVYQGTTALAPGSSIKLLEELYAWPLPLLSKCSGLEQLSCKDILLFNSIQGLPPGLKALDISGTSVTDLSPLRECAALRQLSANYMAASIHHPQLLAVLRQLTALQRLELKQNRLGPADIQALTPAIQGLGQLQHLDLSRNGMGAGGARALAPAIQGLTTLRTLHLSAIVMGAEGAQALAPALQHLTGLQLLELRYNQLYDEGARALALAIQGLTRLQRLGLCWNRMGPAGITALAPSIMELRALQSLDLGYNKNLLEAGAAPALALALRELSGLQELQLSCCTLSAPAALTLAPAIKALPRLKVRLTNQE